MNRDALQKSSKEDLIALVLAQADVIAKLTGQVTLLEKRLADLEAKLGKTAQSRPQAQPAGATRGGAKGPPRRGSRPG